jgi:NitT/TauT family transport system substrate-binding protein
MKRPFFLTILFVAGVGLAMMGWMATRPSADMIIRMGINPWPGYEPLFLAEQRGLFEKHGLKVHLVEFTSVGDCLRGYQSGDIDAMASTLIEVALATDQGLSGSPTPVIVADVSEGADVILAKSAARGMADVRGQRIGVEPASLGMFILDRALAKAGMTRADITLVTMGQEEMQTALMSGAVAAVVTYAPYSIAMEKEGAHPIFTTKEIPNEVVDIVSVTPGLLQAQPEVAGKFQAVWTDAMTLLERDRDASVATMAARQRISPEEFLVSLEGIRLVGGDQQADLLAPGGEVERSLAQVRKILAVGTPK